MPVFDPSTARIRMRILNKPGIQNITWYSVDKYTDSSKPDKDIIAGMQRRFITSRFAANAQVTQFYDNKTGNKLDEYKL